MAVSRPWLRSSRPDLIRYLDLVERAAQIIARMGYRRSSRVRMRPYDIYRPLTERPVGAPDDLVQLFQLRHAHELLDEIAAIDDADPHSLLERRALHIAETMAAYRPGDGPPRIPRPAVPGERRSERSSWQRRINFLFSSAFAAAGTTQPALRALSLLTLLDRSPDWFRQLRPEARETYVRWAVANLLEMDFQ